MMAVIVGYVLLGGCGLLTLVVVAGLAWRFLESVSAPEDDEGPGAREDVPGRTLVPFVPPQWDGRARRGGGGRRG